MGRRTEWPILKGGLRKLFRYVKLARRHSPDLCVSQVVHTVGVVDVRVVGTDEWPLWRDVRLEALTRSPEAFASRLEDWERGGERKWRERLMLPGACNLVAEHDGAVVGLVRGVPEGDEVVELHSVWVHPDVRGRGVGGRLIAAVETWARDSGARVLRLDVLPGNDEAIALYRRHGFAFDGEPDLGGPELTMLKPLR